MRLFDHLRAIFDHLRAIFERQVMVEKPVKEECAHLPFLFSINGPGDDKCNNVYTYVCMYVLELMVQVM